MAQVVDLIGGPDRDRTDDLFHAMAYNINGIIDICWITGDQEGTPRSTARMLVCLNLCPRLRPLKRSTLTPNRTQLAGGLL